MHTIEVNGRLVDNAATLFHYRPDDLVEAGGRKARVMGVADGRELCFDLGAEMEFRDSGAGINLLIREGFEYVVGHIVKAMSPNMPFNGEQGFILSIDPATQMVLVEFERYEKAEGDATWIACPFANNPHRLWMNPLLHRLERVGFHKSVRDASVGERIVYPVPERTAEMQAMPEWFREFDQHYKAGLAHCYLLWGNIHDWQKRRNGRHQTLGAFLTDTFRQRDFVMYYSISTGLRFANDVMEKDFKERYLKPKEPPKQVGMSDDVRDIKAAFEKKFDAMSVAELMGGTTPTDVFPFVEMALVDNRPWKTSATGPSAVIIVEYAHHVFPKNEFAGDAQYGQRVISETMQRWAADTRILNRKNLIFMITPDFFGVDADLRGAQRVHAIQIKVPSEAERIERAGHWLSSGNVPVEEGMAADRLGRVTTGFSLRDIDGIFRLTAVKQEQLTFRHIKARKKAIYKERFGDRINVIEPGFGFDYFGGREEAKAYCRKISRYMETGMLRRVPMGILAPGPPGTGKSFFFQCWAHECGFNFVEIANPRAMFVGQSEEIFDSILLAIEELAPVIVYEDEADQGESSRDAMDCDSGVSNRLRQKKFIFCSDPKRRGRVVWVRVSNRDDLLDAAYKRKGRSDQVIPFVLQTAEEMKDIFRVMFARYAIPTTVTDFTPYVQEVKKKIYCTGVDIEWMVLEADDLCGEAERQAVTSEDLLTAIDSWELKNSPVQIDRQIVAALEGSSRKLRPAGWQIMLAEAKERLTQAGARWNDGDGHRPEPPIGPSPFSGGIASGAMRHALRERRRT